MNFIWNIFGNLIKHPVAKFVNQIENPQFETPCRGLVISKSGSIGIVPL